MLANIPIGTGAIPGLTTPGAIYVAILESRTVREGVVERVSLVDVYKAENMEEAVEKLSKKTDITISDEGVIELKATARTPRRAAEIANTYIEKLDLKNTELSIAQAKHNRVFIEGRLSENKEALREAEDNFRRFQEKYKAISLPEQTAAAIEAAAVVLGELQALEVQRDVLLVTMRPANPKVVQIQTQMDALKKQLDRMAYGSRDMGEAGDSSTTDHQLYVPFSDVPAVGLELARLTREFKIQEVIFELLTQQHEQAKLQEAKNTPTVQIIDTAVPPEKRSKPVRSVIVLFGGGLSIVLSLILIAWVEYVHRMRTRNPQEYDKVRGVSEALKKDFHTTLGKVGLKKRK
jgi:uncharacterized protein involved in exopolysaccharide biosynthesis